MNVMVIPSPFLTASSKILHLQSCFFSFFTLKFANMKTSTFLLALFLFIAGSSFAQDGSTDQKAKALTDRMKTQLTLNDDQYKQVYDINLDFVTKLGTVKEN